ncbi:MAG: Gfo/Idh/MocA family oxidoreductase [Spirochaetaceae bacterium]|nr:Gfo/Idh/MocA family oxidoreductase [Spirochaetaceae bacterium]
MTRRSPRSRLGVAVVGFGWMGQVHARAYSRVLQHYPDLAVAPSLVVVADPEQERLDDAVSRFGFEAATTSWQAVLTDDRVEAVSVTAPNFLHREIGEAVARAGKHLWIEKPVGLSLADAESVAAAVSESGVQSAVGFNYRNAPAVSHARNLVAQGAIGRVTNARFRLLTDYAAHPHGALTWRFQRDRGGSGVLGDLVSHGVDLARHLLGPIESLVADTAVFIDERPRPSGAANHFALAEGGEPGPVENEDYLSCLLQFAGGARGSLEASRTSVGDQCTYGFEIHGTTGALSWDFRRMGELGVSVGEGYLDQTVQTTFVGPGTGEAGAFQPGAGIALSYDDLKVIEAARFLQSIADGGPPGATVEDAVHSARALDAMTRSVAERAWVTL